MQNQEEGWVGFDLDGTLAFNTPGPHAPEQVDGLDAG